MTQLNAISGISAVLLMTQLGNVGGDALCDVLTGKFEPKYGISASTGCIAAGNDIQMPGCQKNVDDIVRAVQRGEAIDGYTITLADLQYNAANIMRVIAKM